MRDVVFDAIDGTLRSIPQKRRSDAGMVQEAVQRAVRAAINEAWGKKPVVTVFVTLARIVGPVFALHFVCHMNLLARLKHDC